NENKEMMTNSAGQFTFPGVTPGTYKVTTTKAGFATFVVANLVVDVNKSYTVDVKMEIRSGNEIVEVSATAQAELETADAVDGNGHEFTQKPEQKDNRGGVSFGGPLRKDKTFVFGNYEFRRFPQALTFTRLIPSPNLKQGILTFGGVPYDLASSSACGAGGNLA